MGLAGRKRRLKNFDERAAQFKSALMKGRSPASKEIGRDFRNITVGAGQHRRLVIKAKPHHAFVADQLAKMLIADMKAKGTSPKTFVLALPRVTEGGVQEYFHKPSINSLVEYLYFGKPKKNSIAEYRSIRHRAILKAKQPHDYALCKQFANQRQNREITAEQLVEAFDEFNSHLDAMKDGLGRVLSSNIIVLGRTKEGKLRLALVDV